MGASESKAREPVVAVPPRFDYPPIAERTRMLVPAYELMFGKQSVLHALFEDYVNQAENITTRVLLYPMQDPHFDLNATVSAVADKNYGTQEKGDAILHWQRELDDPHNFVDLLMSTSNPMCQLRSCAYYPKYRIGAFGTLPLLIRKRVPSEDYGVMGLRYVSENLSLGASFVPFPLPGREMPFGAWLVARKGNLCVGAQYKPLSGNKQLVPFTDLENWNCAVSYAVGSTSPLSPSSTFTLELARSTQLTASFYQHLVVQESVKRRLHNVEVVGSTNYIDVGLELAAKIGKDNPAENGNSSLQIAASWQPNENFLLKGKLGPSKSSAAVAFKPIPSFTFSITAVNYHSNGTTSYGFGIQAEDLRQPSYQIAHPTYIMLTPSKIHLAENILRDSGKPPIFRDQVESGNYDNVPPELKPIGGIL